MTHGIRPDSNWIFLIEKTINPAQQVHHLTHQMTHDLTHDFAFTPTTNFSILKQDSGSIICLRKKEFQRLLCRFYSLFHTTMKNNIPTFLYLEYLIVMAYSLCSSFTFKSVAL